jgi:hypothetical protein
MATVVHRWLERRTVCEIGYERLLETRKLKITKWRQIGSLRMTSFRACRSKLLSLPFSMGMRLMGIFFIEP